MRRYKYRTLKRGSYRGIRMRRAMRGTYRIFRRRKRR